LPDSVGVVSLVVTRFAVTATVPVLNVRVNAGAAVLGFPAASVAAFAAMLTVIAPAAVGTTLNVYVLPLVAVKFATVPPVTWRSLAANPVTSSLKVTVNGTGLLLVGSAAVLDTATVGAVVSTTSPLVSVRLPVPPPPGRVAV